MAVFLVISTFPKYCCPVDNPFGENGSGIAFISAKLSVLYGPLLEAPLGFFS
ncbi:unnamed protein product [Brugia timori]|uniref:Uncharacterized protein n=1 Tax=Brugia timori TaxID=42155 RepID=A0A3P7W8P0_9BILA|nr:unnamed protein product [Brugia timori]